MVRGEGQSETVRRRGRLRAGLRGFLREEAGTSALEFAIVSVPLFFLILALFQVAFVYFANFALENATSRAARLVRTGQAQDLTATKFKAEICKEISAPLSCSGLELDVRKYNNFGSAAKGLTQPLDGSGNMKKDFSYDPGGSGDVMVIRAFYPLDIGALLPSEVSLSNMAGNKRVLAATAAFRNEPF
jgi:Flp pilus assembly protein TadG